MLRLDTYGKRKYDAKARAAAAAIGHYLYPDNQESRTAPVVASAAYFMDAQARFDFADFARQVAWFKAQGLIDRNIAAHAMVDLTLIKSLPEPK